MEKIPEKDVGILEERCWDARGFIVMAEKAVGGG